MAAPTNMDLFNAFTLALFKVLYEHFPSPTDINASKIAIELLPEKLDDEDGLRLFTAADNAVLWLEKEGFITAGYVSMDSRSEFSDVLLTSRGLAVLNSTPDAISSKATISSQITDLFGETARDAAKDEVKEQLRFGAARIMGYVINAAAGWLGTN